MGLEDLTKVLQEVHIFSELDLETVAHPSDGSRSLCIGTRLIKYNIIFCYFIIK